jgi:SprT-like family
MGNLMAKNDITARLRAHQEQDAIVGDLFKALHVFADRTIKEYYLEDYPDMPYPVLAMEKDRRSRKGYYTVVDGYRLIHRINLNPYALKTGEDAAETLVHEMVHLWQGHVGRPIKRNYHSAEFHQKLAEFGIISQGKRGDHIRYEIEWHNWLAENADLNLDKFKLPGMDEGKRRMLLKHICPDCGVNFRSRKELNVLCLDCSVPFEIEGEGEDEEISDDV